MFVSDLCIKMFFLDVLLYFKQRIFLCAKHADMIKDIYCNCCGPVAYSFSSIPHLHKITFFSKMS